MIIDRKALIEHLQHVSCDGLLKDAVLTDRFQCRGVSVNQDLLVIAGGLEKISPLAGDIGVVNLDLLLKVLEIGEEEQLAFEVDGPHIIIQSKDQKAKLVTAASRVIGSRVEPHIVEQLLKGIPNSPWIPLSFRVVSGILSAIDKLRAEQVVLLTGPQGTTVVVGEERQNSISFVFPELVVAESYKLTFHSALIKPVLKQVRDYTKAEMILTGKDSIVPIREGPYMYVMSPAKDV